MVMKKVILGFAVFSLASSVFAEGYVGFAKSKGKISYDCNSGLDCKKSADLLKFYAGTKLDDRSQIDIAGLAKIEAIEFGYWRGVKPSASGLVTQSYYDEDEGTILYNNSANTNYVPVKFSIGFDALTAAGVARANLADDINLAVRLGVAYVTATKKADYAGQSSKSSSASKFKPYLGFSLEYSVIEKLKLVGSVDWSQYEVDGTKGSIKAVGVGAEYEY
jgi:hypothetical protein